MVSSGLQASALPLAGLVRPLVQASAWRRDTLSVARPLAREWSTCRAGWDDGIRQKRLAG